MTEIGRQKSDVGKRKTDVGGERLKSVFHPPFSIGLCGLCFIEIFS